MIKLSAHAHVGSVQDLWSYEPHQPASHPLLEKLATEAQSAALLTAATASVANALVNLNPARVPAEMQRYRPDASALTWGLRSLSRDSDLPAATRLALVEFYADLKPALASSDQFTGDCATLGNERAAALHQFILARAWRKACLSATSAIETLMASAAHVLPDLYQLNTGILSRLLAATACGQSPCIDAGGGVFLPAMPQRRRASRKTLAEKAVVRANGRDLHVFVRDVSTGGMGLEQTRKLKEGAHITLELPTGRAFSGTIVWSKGMRAGLRFDRPISPNDPILWG